MNDLDDNESISPLDIIEKIKNKELNPRILTNIQRRECIIALEENYSYAQLARIFQRSIKTIQRDMDQIHRDYALKIDKDVGERISGKIIYNIETNRRRLMRTANDPNTPAAVKVAAEFAAGKLALELFDRYRVLGYFSLVIR